jgi:glycosyltransferase involved in cell wall biosynthesis
VREVVRLYGRVIGNGSHARVTAGFRGELEHREILAGVVGIDAEEPPGSEPIPGATAPVGLYTGPLERVEQMLVGTAHERRYAMLAPNSDTLPPQLIASLERACTHLLVPSKWAAAIARQWTKLPIDVVPHGLAHGFRSGAATERERVGRIFDDEGVFLVMHFSSSSRERKGTRLLIEAWDDLIREDRLAPGARLVCVLEYDAYALAKEWRRDGLNPPGLWLELGMNLQPDAFASLIACNAHVVCQPSRGEAFGMIPLEARACGVPVVATACTGHSEHIEPGDPGVIVVPHGELRPIDDLPGARAPEVTRQAIADALGTALAQWPELERAAASDARNIRDRWSWERSLAPWLSAIGEKVRA